MTSTKDIQPVIRNILLDGKWHAFAEILNACGDKIMPERAVRFYMNTGHGAKSKDKDGPPLEDKVRAGRRRGVYLALQNLTKSRLIECKNIQIDPDNREFKILTWPEAGSPASSKRPKLQKESMPGTPVVGGYKSLIALIDNVEREFPKAFPGTGDWRDFGFHCRSLRRIIMANTVAVKPVLVEKTAKEQ